MFVFLLTMSMFEYTRPARNANKTLHAFADVSHSGFYPSAVRRFLPRVQARRGALLWSVGIAALLASCASGPPPPEPPAISPAQARGTIENLLPGSAADRRGWAADMYAAFSVLDIPPNRQNICAVIAVTEQESGFRVDPVVPGLPAIAWREIDSRAERAGVPHIIVHTALQLKSPTGLSYSDRIDRARTEKDLSNIFEDFIGAVPMGRTLFAERNPIRTRGPMQVNVAFAEQYSAARPYPYPVKVSIADELFTRRGSLYFGTAHLLAYSASYDSYIYRFADFNAGQYASRSAAFQHAVSSASGVPLTPDGALLPHDSDLNAPGSTELAVRTLGRRLNMSENAIHKALQLGKTTEFDRTQLYLQVFALADQAEGRPVPRAMIPRIQLHGPKIARRLTTDWYAHRVDQRFRLCLSH
jgi:hypothetical protein